MNALEAVVRAKEMLRDKTPVNGDCGKTCGAACCDADENGEGGMLLFPAEIELYKQLPQGMVLSRDDSVSRGMTLYNCDGTCQRENRPLACMFFPLTPYIDKNGEVKVKMDVRAWLMCPLMEYGKAGLSREFVAACSQAAQLLCLVPEHREYIEKLTEFLRQYRTF